MSLDRLRQQAYHAIEEHLWMPPCTCPSQILDLFKQRDELVAALKKANDHLIEGETIWAHDSIRVALENFLNGQKELS